MSQLTADQSIRGFTYSFPWMGLQLEAFDAGDRILVGVDEVCRLFGLDVLRETARLQGDLGATVKLLAHEGKRITVVALDVMLQWLMLLDAADVAPAMRGRFEAFQTATTDHLNGLAR